MRARVTTYGGDLVKGSNMRYVQHWQLIVDEEFIADTSIPRMGDKFIEIAEAINEVAST